MRASSSSGLSKELLSQLRSVRWIAEHLNVLFTGQTGVGKTHLACALGQYALRRGHRTTYKRLQRLLEDLAGGASGRKLRAPLVEARKEPTADHRRLGTDSLKDSHRRDILEILEDRHGRASTVFTSQLPISKWYGYIGERAIAGVDADRRTPNGGVILREGPAKWENENDTLRNSSVKQCA